MKKTIVFATVLALARFIATAQTQKKRTHVADSSVRATSTRPYVKAPVQDTLKKLRIDSVANNQLSDKEMR